MSDDRRPEPTERGIRAALTREPDMTLTRIVARESIAPTVDDPRFVRLCLDVLAAKAKPTRRDDRDQFAATLLRLMNNHCPAGATEGGQS